MHKSCHFEVEHPLYGSHLELARFGIRVAEATRPQWNRPGCAGLCNFSKVCVANCLT